MGQPFSAFCLSFRPVSVAGYWADGWRNGYFTSFADFGDNVLTGYVIRLYRQIAMLTVLLAHDLLNTGLSVLLMSKRTGKSIR